MSRIRYIFKMSLASAYSISIFCYGICLCLFKPFHPNILHKICRMISWKSQEILGIKIIHRGVEFFNHSKPMIIMSNHQDNFDVVIGASCLPPRTVLIGKRSLFWIPFFGPFFWLSGNFLISRKNKDSAKASMLEVTRRVNEEHINIWILPEGTRSRGRGFLPFKKGGFITAIDCQVPIVPVVWSSYVKHIDFSKPFSGTVISSTLEPISTKGLTHDDLEELMQKVHGLMKAELARIDKEAYGV